ncbi:MAG: accessory gene regulator B family protein [Ruoffia tabacinasalis]|uniref:Accessory gene regulator B family protein n=1 Tax=Ruoffia tabacinasalis TaxID=87458 RepID=A0ABS0LLZ3_9LACT|nr:accessory gene regulator B family protein [Ruoffia tabacinasalis]
MINRISRVISKSISRTEIEECINFGLSIIVHQLLGFIIAVFVGVLFGTVSELVIVIFLYIPLRVCGGDYHASTLEQSLLFSEIMFVLISLCLKHMVWDSTLLIQLVFILLYIIDVLIKVPNSVRNRF